MPNLTFETASQTDATLFAAGDVLAFRDAAPGAIAAAYIPAAGGTGALIALSYAGKTLTFSAAALDHGAAITFNDQGGVYHLADLGTDAADALDLYSIRDRAIWTFAGEDAIRIAGTGRITVHAGAGADRVTVDNAEGADGRMQPTGDYLVDGGEGNDVLDLRFATGPLSAWGGAGADRIVGGLAGEHLYGNSAAAAAGSDDGADTIDGGGGNDYIQGNAGRDVLFGGAGNDRLYGGADDDYLSGEDGNDYLQGNRGNDTIDGDGGNDIVRGGAGDDLINGGTGDDILFGDLGNDVIRGGSGIDVMTGGEGQDIFGFGGGDATFAIAGPRAGLTDIVTDFTRGADHIALGYAVQAVLTAPTYYFTTIEGAADHAQTLMNAHAGDREVVSLLVGSDTVLFFASGGGNMVDSAVRLQGVDPASMALADFGE